MFDGGPSDVTVNGPFVNRRHATADSFVGSVESIFSIISELGMGRPKSSSWRASCSLRALVLSRDIKSPDFSWALARFVSASPMFSATSSSSLHTVSINSPADSALVPS